MSDAPQLEAATAASVHLALTNLLSADLVDASLDRLCAVLITQVRI